jgi:hypothetical protein
MSYTPPIPGGGSRATEPVGPTPQRHAFRRLRCGAALHMLPACASCSPCGWEHDSADWLVADVFSHTVYQHMRHMVRRDFKHVAQW